MLHYVIIGGGISGLSSAYYLSKLFKPSTLKITVLEASKRVGGWIDSTRTLDGAVFDNGPRSVRGAGKVGLNTLELVEDLNLSSQILPICRNHPAALKRYIYVDGQLCPLPNSLGGVIKKVPPFRRSLMRQVWKEPFTPKVPMLDDSVYNFFSRRFSKDMAHYLIDPMCRGIFAGNARELSIKACFKPLFKWEQENGSVIKGALFAKKEQFEEPKCELIERYKAERWAMWSMRHGLQQLTDAMEQRLQEASNVQLLKNSPVDAIQFTADNKIQVKSGDQVIEADHVISSILSTSLGSLVQSQHPELSAHLSQIPSVHCAVIHLEYSGNVFNELAFGHLIPSSEKTKVLGFIYSSSIFPQHNKQGEETTRLTCMMGGAWFDELFGDVDSVDVGMLEAEAVKAAREQLGIHHDPIRVLTRVHKNCIAQYLVGHCERVDAMEGYIDAQKLPLSLTGASYKGVSVNDCIYNSKVDAEKLVQNVS